MSLNIEKNDTPPEVMGYQMDPAMPLHRLAVHRIRNNRDLKIIITAKDSETGVGKTTCAGWLALTWTKLFTEHEWFVDNEEYGKGMGTVNPKEYFAQLKRVGSDYDPGTVLIVDDAEELDARRSMQHLNVEFSQRWMLMRIKQAITIITLPSPRAIDTRLEELSDVWINIERRGRGLVHDIRVNSYGNRSVMTEQKHKIEFPDMSTHPELEGLRRMKEAKMDDWEEGEEGDGEEEVDPEQVERETLIDTAQQMRNNGFTAQEIAENIEYGQDWVYKYTESPDGE